MHNTASTQPLRMESLLDHVIQDCPRPKIQIREILAQLGSRIYGPGMLLLAAIELLPFVSAIPGMFVITATGILLLAAQLLMGRQTPWFPSWFLNYSLPRKRLVQLDRVAKPWAKWIDGIVKARWESLVSPPFTQAIAIACIALALSFFPLSPIPAAEKIPAIPIALFALAITARDGVMALLGFTLVLLSLALLVYFWPTIAGASSQALSIFGVG